MFQLVYKLYQLSIQQSQFSIKQYMSQLFPITMFDK